MTGLLRRLFPIALVLLALTPAAAAAEVRGALPMTEGWEFADEAEGPWRAVDVPHVMDPEPRTEVWEGRVAWYRMKFRGPETADGRAWSLRFGQARRRAEAFLNGRPIGRNADPYTPFSLAARGLRPGRENTLVVRVDNRRTPGMREGWWNWGGITREVHLVPRGRVELKDTGLLSEVDCEGRCRAQVRIDTWLTNRTGEALRPRVDVRLRAPDGNRRPADHPRTHRPPGRDRARAVRRPGRQAGAVGARAPGALRRDGAGPGSATPSSTPSRCESDCAPWACATGTSSSTAGGWTCAARRSRRTSRGGARR
jgi:hypothetical protein